MALAATTAVFATQACAPASKSAAPSDNPPAAVHAVAPSAAGPFDVNAFASDARVRRQALAMPFEQVATQLGSVQFAAQASYVFSRGGDEYTQTDTALIERDAAGNTHVRIKTPDHQIEIYQVGAESFVRQDTGLLRRRHTSGEDQTAQAWCTTAFSGLWQTLALFAGHIAYTQPSNTTAGGRAALTINLSRKTAAPRTPGASATQPPTQEAGKPRPPPTTQTSGEPHDAEQEPPGPQDQPLRPLAFAPVARWRELSTPLDLQGTLLVDATTGAVLSANIVGRLEINDRQVRPTELTIRYEASLSSIGRVKAITVPKSADEFARQAHPSDPLSFLRPQLGQPTDGTTRPAATPVAGAGADAGPDDTGP